MAHTGRIKNHTNQLIEDLFDGSDWPPHDPKLAHVHVPAPFRHGSATCVLSNFCRVELDSIASYCPKSIRLMLISAECAKAYAYALPVDHVIKISNLPMQLEL
jgi:hypothetical protein